MAAPMTIWERQSIGSDITGVKHTFSSWDACMEQDYCKYPIIIAIVVVSLILFSIVFCVARCLCCGLECCCGCLACCNACCPSPRGGRKRSSKYADGPGNSQQGPYQGYQPTPAPVYNVFQGNGPTQPQYAQFDVSKRGKVNEDALPAMPSWENSSSRKVMDEHKDDDVELGTLDPVHEHNSLLANQAPTPRVGYNDASPGLPYSDFDAQNGGNLSSPYEQQTAYGVTPINSYGQPPRTQQTGYDQTASPSQQYQRPPQTYNRAPQYGNQAMPAERLQTASPLSYDAPRPAQPYGGSPAPAYARTATYDQSQYTPYAASESTRYEPSNVTYGSRPPPVRQYPDASGGPPPVRKPLQDSWREV